MERYVAGVPPGAVAVEHPVRRLLEQEGADGSRGRIRHLSSTFVPADEMCLLLVEAASSAAVRDAFARADVEFERISEVHHVASAPGTREGDEHP